MSLSWLWLGSELTKPIIVLQGEDIQIVDQVPEWHHRPSGFDQLGVGLRDLLARWRHWSVRTLICMSYFSFPSQFCNNNAMSHQVSCYCTNHGYVEKLRRS